MLTFEFIIGLRNACPFIADIFKQAFDAHKEYKKKHAKRMHIFKAVYVRNAIK